MAEGKNFGEGRCIYPRDVVCVAHTEILAYHELG